MGLPSCGPIQAEQRTTAVSRQYQPSASSVDLSSPGRESGYHHSITQEQAHHQDA